MAVVMLRSVDAYQFGAVLRLARMRRGWTQQQLADSAGVSRWSVSLAERGQIGRLQVNVLTRLCLPLDAHVDVSLRWRGAEAERLLNADHARMHEWAGGQLELTGGWVFASEVSFSIYGERGVIDILAFHPTTGTLLVIELKTALIDPQRLVGDMDRRRRLAARIAADRGWRPARVALWVVVLESRTNRRRLAAASGLLRRAFPVDGRGTRSWLRAPTSDLAALSFLPSVALTGTGPVLAGRRRVSKRRVPAGRARAPRPPTRISTDRAREAAE